MNLQPLDISMTIESTDIRHYESTTEGFKYQPDLQDCLPVAVKNILDEIAERHDKQQIKCSESDIKSMSEYDSDFGTTGRLLIPGLSAELEEYGYTVKDQTNTSIPELESILEKRTSSYPVVSLSPDYFDSIPDWDPRGSRRGKNNPHSVIPFKVNSEEVLFFDPYGGIQLRSGLVTEPKKRLEQREFFGYWNTENSFPRWTLWIERMQETTLRHFE